MLMLLTKFHVKTQWCVVLLMYTIGVVWSNLMVPDSIVGYPMYLRFPWNADVVFIALPYLYIGYRFRDIFINSRSNVSKNIYLVMGVLALGIIMIAMYAFVSGNMNFLIDMRYSVYKNWLLTLLIPGCFFVVLFLLSKALEKVPIINNALFISVMLH